MTPDPSGASFAVAEASAAEDTVTVGSLCSGYTGLDMGLALALGVPLRHAWHVEYDGINKKGELTGPRKILAHRFPDVPNYGDVKLAPWHDMEPVDWLTAGYPCQPFSLAGLRKGADDPRHLWPGVARAIGVLRPRRVLLENVAAHLRDGFDVVLADLAGMGYDATWGVVRASDAGAPHGRARLFVVASVRHTGHDAGGTEHRQQPPVAASGPRESGSRGADSDPAAQRRGRTEGQQRGMGPAGLLPHAPADADDLRHERSRSARGRRVGSADGGIPAADSTGHGWGEGRAEPAWLVGGSDAAICGLSAPAHADGAGGEALDGRPGTGDAGRLQSVVSGDPARDVQWGAYAPAVRRWEAITGRPAPRPTEPGRNGERLSPRFVEWLMGLAAGWVTDVPDLPRNAQLKALGNGVVPQQAALAVRLLTATTAAEAAA